MLKCLLAFTRALTCLSRYGEELSVHVTQDTLALSCTNSSKSAYCRFTFSRNFFSRFRLGDSLKTSAEVDISSKVTGQLMAKSLLSILKHKTVETTVEKCEISIIEGVPDQERDVEEEERDGLESVLVVRLHCKHGVVKTHNLLLLTSTSIITPGVPDSTNESLLTIGPRAIRDMVEQFPLPKGAKFDPQLIWNFGESEVAIRTLESSSDSRGKAQLSTELTISVDEFDVYDLYAAPITIAFHLREFNATIAFAESSSLSLDLRFTDPTAPLFIDIEGDNYETLFVISTSQVQVPPNQIRQASNSIKKRIRDDTSGDSSRFKKPMKVVQSTDRASVARQLSTRNSFTPELKTGSCSGLNVEPSRSFKQTPTNDLHTNPQQQQPLFFPGSSQLSIMDPDALRESGLGLENMDADELSAMLGAEGVEILPSQQTTGFRPRTGLSDLTTNQRKDSAESFEVGDETEMKPTQDRTSDEQSRAFFPLFAD